MHWRMILISLVMVLPSSALASDSPAVSDPVHISNRHTRVMTSEVMGEDRRFSVHLPRGYEQQPNRSYPMMIVLDGGAWAGLMAETLHSYRMRGAAPPVIVVGIENTDRTRDLTTTHVEGMPTSGGADKFAKFLGDELMPFIDQEYRTNDYRIIFGHSFGGLFGVYTQICHQELGFNACIAASPALYYDRGPTLRKIEQVLADNPPEGPQFFYLSMADELTYAEALDFLKDQFGDEDWVRWKEKRYDDETHGSVPKRVIPDGVEALFANWSMSRNTVNNWGKVVAHHKKLSEQMGYEVLVPEGLANNIGYQELNRGDFSDAIKIFEWNAQTYPASVNVWDSLGEAMLARGKLADAVANYEKVLSMDPDNANAIKMLEVIAERQSNP